MKRQRDSFSMKILVCGGRDYEDYGCMRRWLLWLKPACIVTGGAKGADSLAMRFAEDEGIELKVHYADWEKYGRAAGPRRNNQMLTSHPDLDLVIAFPGGAGTSNMTKQAKEAGVSVLFVRGGIPKRRLT